MNFPSRTFNLSPYVSNFFLRYRISASDSLCSEENIFMSSTYSATRTFTHPFFARKNTAFSCLDIVISYPSSVVFIALYQRFPEKLHPYRALSNSTINSPLSVKFFSYSGSMLHKTLANGFAIFIRTFFIVFGILAKRYAPGKSITCTTSPCFAAIVLIASNESRYTAYDVTSSLVSQSCILPFATNIAFSFSNSPWGVKFSLSSMCDEVIPRHVQWHHCLPGPFLTQL